MRMLDLFSGIGGFSLAAYWVWGEELEIASFVEINPFCQRVLGKYWPNVPIISDIREVDTKDFQNIDLITGGFPCQPFSCAGKRKGKSDDRYLWPDMFRVIVGVKPRWVLAENVPGIVNVALEQCISDLEAEGYEVGAMLIPACGVGAPHRRERLWIVGYSKGTRDTQFGQPSCGTNPTGKMWSQQPNITDCHASNANGPRSQGSVFRRESESETEELITGCAQESLNATYPTSDGLHDIGIEGWIREGSFNRKSCGSSQWSEGWHEAATRLCGMAHGVSRGLHRVDRLKALGNSIVPQVAYEILCNIKRIEQSVLCQG